MREVVGIDVIVEGPSVAQTRERMDEAKAEEVLVRVDDLGDLARGVGAAVRRGEEPLDGPGLPQPVLQRMDPGGTDELDATRALEVDRTPMLARPPDL